MKIQLITTAIFACVLNTAVLAQETDSEKTDHLDQRQATREALRQMTPEERQAHREELRATLEGLSEEEKTALRERRQLRRSAHQREHRRLRNQETAEPETSDTEAL